MSRPHSTAGHTLLELLTALAVVAALATLATASYTHFLVAARRFDARAALLALAAAQERHFLRHARYARELAVRGDPGEGADPPPASPPLVWPELSPQEHYALSIAAEHGAGYRLEARPRGPQQRDGECALFVLEGTGLRTAYDRSGHETTRRCWGA